jgi:Flp pilus assembly protein TadG
MTDKDRGSVTLELTILTPALIALLGLAMIAGRFEIAAGAVEHASAAAARAASLARTAPAADRAANVAAAASLADQNLRCGTVDVQVETAGFGAPAGQPAQVAVTVACQLDLASLGVPGVPGSRDVRSRSVSVLDTYRSR